MFTGGTGHTTEAHLYNFDTGVWTTLASMPRGRTGHVCKAVSSIAGGVEVVVAGGFADNTCNIYSVATGAWTDCAPLPETLYAASSELMGKKMYVAGGFAATGRTNKIYR